MIRMIVATMNMPAAAICRTNEVCSAYLVAGNCSGLCGTFGMQHEAIDVEAMPKMPPMMLMPADAVSSGDDPTVMMPWNKFEKPLSVMSMEKTSQVTAQHLARRTSAVCSSQLHMMCG